MDIARLTVLKTEACHSGQRYPQEYSEKSGKMVFLDRH